MPNHVTNRITFDALKAPEVFAIVLVDGEFSFEPLVPMPPNLYHGDLSGQDSEDFPINWDSWSRENWGTKWGAYGGSNGIDGDTAWIQFDTAWSPPWPVMAAFCNRFQIPFKHSYFDEGHNFWGTDTWDASRWGNHRIQRTEKRWKVEADCEPLGRLLKGYDDAYYAEVAAERAAEARARS